MELLAREPMLLALNERHALAACELIDVAALRDETLIAGMATLRAATGLGVTLVPVSMGDVQFPGVAYRPLKTRAFMDVHCYYPRRGAFAAAGGDAGDGAGVSGGGS